MDPMGREGRALGDSPPSLGASSPLPASERLAPLGPGPAPGAPSEACRAFPGGRPGSGVGLRGWESGGGGGSRVQAAHSRNLALRGGGAAGSWAGGSGSRRVFLLGETAELGARAGERAGPGLPWRRVVMDRSAAVHPRGGRGHEAGGRCAGQALLLPTEGSQRGVLRCLTITSQMSPAVPSRGSSCAPQTPRTPTPSTRVTPPCVVYRLPGRLGSRLHQ